MYGLIRERLSLVAMPTSAMPISLHQYHTFNTPDLSPLAQGRLPSGCMITTHTSFIDAESARKIEREKQKKLEQNLG